MRFAALSAALALASSTLAISNDYEWFTYIGSDKYADPNTPVSSLACSSVLAGEGYEYVGNITGNLAGFANITGGDLSLCGQCATLDYAGGFLDIVIVDTASTGLVVEEGAYNSLASANPDEPEPPIQVLVLQVYNC